jgi:hypothetical protein
VTISLPSEAGTPKAVTNGHTREPLQAATFPSAIREKGVEQRHRRLLLTVDPENLRLYAWEAPAACPQAQLITRDI